MADATLLCLFGDAHQQNDPVFGLDRTGVERANYFQIILRRLEVRRAEEAFAGEAGDHCGLSASLVASTAIASDSRPFSSVSLRMCVRSWIQRIWSRNMSRNNSP